MSHDYDVVIVGGGIHGVGVAQAAAAAGYTALLLEQSDLAAGTSSRSSKLIHGGLRYLEGAHFGLVRESLRERRLLIDNAPKLVQLTPFYIPIYRHTTRRPWQIRAGLSLYALLGNLSSATRFRAVPRYQWGRLDGLRTEDLQAVYQYWDAQTDDAALTRAVMHSARSLGAELACPARFSEARLTQHGYLVTYQDRAGQQQCRARTLVNAAGPWVNQVLDHIRPAPHPPGVALVQGSHILMPGELQWGIYYIEAVRDRRAVFVMPWQEGILVGTTETPYTGDPAAAQPLADEIDYLTETFSHYFPGHARHVLSSYAGLRVLPSGEGHFFHRSRETVFHRETHLPGLVSIYGGKLTAYRATAAKVMARLQPLLPAREPKADTATLALLPEG